MKTPLIDRAFRGSRPVGKSLNPSPGQIRAMEIEEQIRRTRRPLHELWPDSERLVAHLNKPVNKLSYYALARCRVKYLSK